MNFLDSIPLEFLFTGTILLIIIAVEAGYRLCNTHSDESKNVKEKITSVNASSIISILSFFLVFTFGIVYSLYDSKKVLVWEEANIIRTVWNRSDFLPEADRGSCKTDKAIYY